MSRLQTKMFFAGVIAISIAGVGFLVTKSTGGGFAGKLIPRLTAAANGSVTPAPPLATEYKNDEYHFSLTMPDGYTTQEVVNDDGSGKTIVLQDVHGDGIQIKVSSFAEDIQTFTADRIHQDIPDMRITDEQPVEIGANHTGIAFRSDNEAFGGASREVWFVFRGNLYQISTYARLDPLLQAMFGTWKFY